MDPKTKQLVEEAEARAEKATEGPWNACLGGVMTDQEEGVCATKNGADSAFIAYARTAMPALCSAIREQDKRAWHAEQERDAYDKRIAELEAQLATRTIPTRKDVAIALLRGIGPNPDEFMAIGKDAFFGLADQIIKMFTDPPSPK
jgi:hypothetical protein